LFLRLAVYANLNRTTRPASLEIRNGSAQQALTDHNQINRKKQDRILHMNGPDHNEAAKFR
jgi:hypothetical protein